ncbi:MAG: hypothetical protein OJI70_05840 [Zavarzinia sp.]|nr:hypothetical protein [Zavarzinia sp.]
MDRERQMAFLDTAVERVRGTIAKWLADPKVRAAVRRNTKEGRDAEEALSKPKKKASA